MQFQNTWRLPREPIESYALVATFLAVVFMSALGVWEFCFAGNKSLIASLDQTIDWTGPVAATILMIITAAEAYGVFFVRQKYLNRGREEGHKEGQITNQKKWEEWIKRKEEAESQNLEFREPIPTID